MRFLETTPIPDSCLFGLVETSFQRAVTMYKAECNRLNKQPRKASIYHSDLRTDGFTWILCDSESGLLACADPLHDYVSLEMFPVAGGSLQDGTTEIRQPYRDRRIVPDYEKEEIDF
ncbi:MAG: hypothetical protein OXC41_08010 [Gammaproteobacteria bacterium]|nr:hypothetical protein [Gammaproteobacteria bacterium]